MMKVHVLVSNGELAPLMVFHQRYFVNCACKCTAHVHMAEFFFNLSSEIRNKHLVLCNLNAFIYMMGLGVVTVSGKEYMA